MNPQTHRWKNANPALLVGYVPETEDHVRLRLTPNGEQTVSIGGPLPLPVEVTNAANPNAPTESLGGNLTVGDTAIEILPEDDQRTSYTIFNNSTDTTVWLGDDNVTTTNGIPVFPQGAVVADGRSDGAAIWGVTESGTADIRWRTT